MIVRLGRLVTVCVVALATLSLALAGQKPQADKSLVQGLEGSVIAPGQPNWDELHNLIFQAFPDKKRFTAKSGTYYIWRIRSEDLVFHAIDPLSTDGDSSAGFYWFDLHGAPISGTCFGTGSRTFYKKCSLVSVPGVSSYVVEATLSGEQNNGIELDFGLDVYRPVLIRYASAGGSLIQNPYCTPNFACGPAPRVFQRSDILEALSGFNPMLQLESLTWLEGIHSNLTADIVNVYHEPVKDSIRYWAISNDSAVSQAAGALESSQIPWVAQAARFYVTGNKPQPVPNLDFQSALKDLVIKELHPPKAGDFDSPDRVVKLGDRVVLQYVITLPNKSVAYTNFTIAQNPSIFQVGSNQVISGLSTGLIGMKVGAARIIEIPARLAYGDAGADVIPPGADLTYKVRLLHIATEPPFGDATERVLRFKDVIVGKGPLAASGTTASVLCSVFRMDGHAVTVPNLSGIQNMALVTGSPIKRAILGMRVGGKRRLLVNSPSVFGQTQEWFHYSAQILEVELLAVNGKH